MTKSVLSLACVWLLVVPSAALAFDIVPISNNDTHDSLPAVSGSRVVWQGCVGTTDFSCFGGHNEIFFWDGSFPIAPIQITNGGGGHVAISGSNVVWVGPGPDGADGEIYFWDGSFPIVPIQITNNSRRESFPAISDSSVAWSECDAPDPTGQCSDGDSEIYYWDGSFPIIPVQITDNILNDRMPAISGSKIVWVGSEDRPGRPVDIYFWDGDAIIRLTEYGDSLARWPDIWGSTVVWKGPLAEPNLLLWNGVFPVAPTPIPGSTSANIPAISGSRVVWAQGQFLDTNIHLWDGQTITNVSNNTGFDNSNPDLSDSMVVWDGCAVHSYTGACLTDREIYVAAIPASPGAPSISFGGGVLLASLMIGTAMYFGRKSTPHRGR